MVLPPHRDTLDSEHQTVEKEMMRWIKRIVIILVVLILGWIGLQSFIGGNNEEEIRTATVERADIYRTVVATGKIEPRYRADIKSRIGGLVSRFFVEAGDRVEVGQRLLEVVPGATPTELLLARNSAQLAYEDKVQAERIFQRFQALIDEELVSPEDYEAARARYQAARVRFVSAIAQLKVLDRGSGEETMSSEFTLSEEESELVNREAGEVIKSMTIRAPIAGIVLSRDTDPGAAVIPMSSAFGGTVLMVIADDAAMHFEGEVDEADIARVHEGLPARINVVSYPDRTIAGVVELISPLGVELANVVRFEVHARIDEGQNLLRAGMSADAELILEERVNVLALPEAALIYEGEETFVQIRDETVEEGYRRLPVKVGISDGIKTEIVEGLKEGDVVVIPEI